MTTQMVAQLAVVIYLHSNASRKMAHTIGPSDLFVGGQASRPVSSLVSFHSLARQTVRQTDRQAKTTEFIVVVVAFRELARWPAAPTFKWKASRELHEMKRTERETQIASW